MMAFQTLTGVAAPLPDSDIDTDVIFPARFLLLLDKAGLGRHLFHERRFDRDGQPCPGFVLNRPPWNRAGILVAGQNFGSGSSREQAVWALADFGIRCVVALSFGEIFFANCFKNGVLAIPLQLDGHARVMRAADAGETVSVDLVEQVIRVADGDAPIGFAVDPHRRDALLQGLDEIGAILADDADAIDRFEAMHRARSPWLHLDRARRASLADLKPGDEL